jgi:hypothetical protein
MRNTVAKNLDGPQFTSLNNIQNLNFLEGLSPQDLLDQINQIIVPIKIHAIYSYGQRHVAWIQGNFKKKLKEN